MPNNSTLLTRCFSNITAVDKVNLLQDKLRHKATAVFKLYYAYLTLPFASIGLIMSILFILAVSRAIKQHRVSRKCYILIINRTIGDVLACVAALGMVIYILSTPEPVRDYVQAMDSFFVSSFWSGMISYVSLSLLKLYAVARPFNYRKTVTMKRCIYLMMISWVFFFVILSYTLGTLAITKIPVLRDWSGCRIETCLRFMYRMRNTLMACIYFATIICFLVTVMFINRARKFVNSFHRNSKPGQARPKILRNRFPMWKLALNVGTFAVFNGFYALWAICLLLVTDVCFFQRNYPQMMRLLGLVRLSLMARIIVDPVLSFITDFQIKRSFLSMMGISSSVQPFDSRKAFQKSTSEDNSSEAMTESTPHPDSSRSDMKES